MKMLPWRFKDNKRVKAKAVLTTIKVFYGFALEMYDTVTGAVRLRVASLI